MIVVSRSPQRGPRGCRATARIHGSPPAQVAPRRGVLVEQGPVGCQRIERSVAAAVPHTTSEPTARRGPGAQHPFSFIASYFSVGRETARAHARPRLFALQNSSLRRSETDDAARCGCGVGSGRFTRTRLLLLSRAGQLHGGSCSSNVVGSCGRQIPLGLPTPTPLRSAGVSSEWRPASRR